MLLGTQNPVRASCLPGVQTPAIISTAKYPTHVPLFFRRAVSVLLALLAFSAPSGPRAQTAPPLKPPPAPSSLASAVPSTPFIPEAEAQTHLTRHVDPLYPEAAAQAEIAGTVFLRITVNSAGQVAHIYPISGPELLIPPAAEAVRRWQYTPFLTAGKPTEIHTNIHVPFGELAAAAEQARLLASYRPLWKTCSAAAQTSPSRLQVPDSLSAPPAPILQAGACRTAASLAAQFTPGTRPVERRQSAQLYAFALVRSGSFKEAANWAAKALPLFAQLPADAPGAVTTCLLLAQARAASGDTLAAAQTLTEAEANLRESLTAAADPNLRRLYTTALRYSLQFHANLLTLLRSPSAAQQKLHEANAL